MAIYDTYKKEVLSASLWLSENGFFGSKRGTGGNVSMRIEERDAMAITPSSVRYQSLSFEDICVVGFDLVTIEEKLAPSVEAGMHGIIYRERPDINAILHTHQIYGSIFSIINRPIPALFDEVSLHLGDIVEVIPYGISGSPDLAKNVSMRLDNGANAYIIQNHGVLTLGKTMEEALFNAELLEKAAKVYSFALMTGKKITTLPKEALEAARRKRRPDEEGVKEK